MIKFLFGFYVCLFFIFSINNFAEVNTMLEEFVSNLSIDQKIGQLFLIGYTAESDMEELKYLLLKHKISGVMIYGKQPPNAEKIKNLNSWFENLYQYSNNIPPFLAVDQEGGSVNRIRSGVTVLPSQLKMGNLSNSFLARQFGDYLASQVADLGFNVDFAPVLDIHTNPNNPVIHTRSLGTSAQIVSKLGIEIMHSLKKMNIVSVIKHFPGHGDTSLDSHLQLPILNHSKTRLYFVELRPFYDAIKAHADMLMTAHILIPSLDKKYPATLSKKIIHDLLRTDLGFEGVVISDDLAMKAISDHYEKEKAFVLAFNAGVDMLLITGDLKKISKSIELFKNEVFKGAIDTDRLNKSVLRILKLKQKYGVLVKKKEEIKEIPYPIFD